MKCRPPAVAGSFYPADQQELDSEVRGFLQGTTPGSDQRPKAIIVPHAGYVYSGAVAASAYRSLEPFKGKVQRVVLLGPSHYVGFRGLAVPGVETDAFSTPLGDIPLDRECIDDLLATFPQVCARDDAHSKEHALEVQLPFLQRTLGAFLLVPIVVGEAAPAETAAVIEHLWGGPETLFVVSSDLSHYHDYETARRCDRATSRAISELEFEHLTPEDACGCYPIQGLLAAARQRGLGAEVIDLRNSGDTAGPRDRVVGYAAVAIG